MTFVPARYTLLSAVVEDTTGASIDWAGGRGVFAAYGTFDSGTAKLQWSPDDGTTWLDVDRSGETYVTFTADGAGNFELPACMIRAVLSGSTTAALTATAHGVDQ